MILILKYKGCNFLNAYDERVTDFWKLKTHFYTSAKSESQTNLYNELIFKIFS